jgi:hypothetical protein
MHADQPVRLYLHLDIIRNAIAGIQRPVFARLVADFEEFVDGVLVDADGTCEGGEAGVG